MMQTLSRLPDRGKNLSAFSYCILDVKGVEDARVGNVGFRLVRERERERGKDGELHMSW